MVELIVTLYYIVSVGVIARMLTVGTTPEARYTWWGVLALAVIYTANSVVTVKQNELAGRIRLGKYKEDLEAGFHFIWWLFDAILIVSTETHNSDMPDEDGKIYQGDVNAPNKDGSPGPGVVPKGFTPALRIMSAEVVLSEPLKVTEKITVNGIEEEVVLGTIQPDNSLLTSQTVEVRYTYGFRVKRGHLQTFFEAVGDVAGAKKNMDDHSLSVFTGILQQKSAAESMFRYSSISNEVKRSLETYSSDWGVEVTICNLKNLIFSHDYNKARTETASAVEQGKKKVTDSIAEKTKRTNEGEGTANAEKAILTARAEGFRKMADVAATPQGQFAMANDTARATARESTLVVEGSGILGGIAGIAKVLGMNPATPTPTPEPEKPLVVLTDDPNFTPKPGPDREKGSRKNRKR